MRLRTGFAALSLACITTSPAVAGHHGWAQASNAGRDALVIAALAIPALQADWQGDVQAGGSLIATAGTTYLLKQLVHEERPDLSDDKSFPSGHTSISFAAAASLEKRYGWHAGAPALLVATFVGVARVEADKHYWHDVVAGAALGGAAGLLLTSKRDDRVRLVPWAGYRSGGVSVAARF